MPELVRTPWLHDRHSHASLYASLIGCPNLAGLGTAACLEVMRSLPAHELSLVFGWHSGLAPFTDGELADLPPVLIVNLSMHGYTLTRDAASLLQETQPEVASRAADAAWGERNLPWLLEFYARTARLTAPKLATFMGNLEALGVYTADDMLLPGAEAFQIILDSPWAEHIQCWATPRTFQSLEPTMQAALSGLKFFTDGALGSRTAALRGTFRDGEEGLLLYDDAALMRTLGECHPFGKPIAVHAIGDRAIEQVLGALEGLDRDGVRFPLVRMEHVQFIDRAQARRAKELGVVLSMQPNFNSDSQDYEDRLEERWLEINNPFRMLIDEVGFQPGQDLLFGSDGMPHGIEYTLQWCLFPRYAGQRLSVAEVVAGYGLDRPRGECLLEVDAAARRVRLVESRRLD